MLKNNVISILILATFWGQNFILWFFNNLLFDWLLTLLESAGFQEAVMLAALSTYFIPLLLVGGLVVLIYKFGVAVGAGNSEQLSKQKGIDMSKSSGKGGAGGYAEVTDGGEAYGGPGGKGGVGDGGPGGHAVASGAGSKAVGGEGGSAAQPDGTGGRGGRSGYKVLKEKTGQHVSVDMNYGDGGDGADAGKDSADNGMPGMIILTYTPKKPEDIK